MLREAGHDVFGIDSGLYKDCDFVVAPAEIASRRMDVRDVTPQDVAGFDAVIHLAGISNDPLGDLNPRTTYDINYKASVRLARLAKQAGVSRFLHASSCSIYGASDSAILDEHAEQRPVTPYGHAKALSEHDIAPMADDRFSPIFLRGATAYGASPRLRADLVANNLVGYAILDGEVRLKSDGRAWRPMVHVEDIARAYVALLEAPRDAVHNQAFNVGRSDENYLVRDIATLVHEAVPDSEVSFASGAGADVRCYRVDCDKIVEQVPGYRPRWTVQTGIAQLVDAYREDNTRRDEFLGAKFQRIRKVRQLQDEGRLDTDLRWKNGNGSSSHRVTQTPRGDSDARFETITSCRGCGVYALEVILALGNVPLAAALVCPAS